MADYVATALTPAAVSAVDRHDGTLYVYHGSEAFEQSRELLGLQRAVGLNRGEVLPSGAAVARFPCLSGWKGGSEGSELSGVFYAGDDHTADARCFTEGVAAAAASLGVKFQFHERVVKIEYDATGTRAMGVVISGADDADRTAVRCVAADDVVLACGIHTPALCPLGSARVPIQPIRGFSIELHGCSNTDGSALPTTAIADYSCGGVQHQLVPFADDKIRVVGFADLVGLDAPTPGAGLGGVAQILTAHTQFLLPTLRWSSASELWAGLRPMTPDNLPYVGRDRYTENVWLCAGHGATGWTTCTGTAEVLAAQLVGGPGYTPDPELSTALDPNRFATSWMSRVAAVAGL
jgi:D-amino-acid dehydrogenase